MENQLNLTIVLALSRTIGSIDCAVFYLFLKSLNSVLIDDLEWKCLTSIEIQKATTLTRKEQERIIKRLIELGYIETKLMGLPAKKHFRIR